MSNKFKKAVSLVAATMLVFLGIFATFKVPAKAEQWKITYFANNGSFKEQSYNYDYPTTVSLPPASALGFVAPEGTQFLGWCRNSNGTGTIFQTGSSYSKLPYSEYLYAIWGVTVTFDVNGGQMKDEERVQVVPMGGKAKEPTAPTTYQTAKEGMSFVGWYANLDPMDDYSAITSKKFNFDTDVISGNTTLTAVYSRSFYIRTLDNSSTGQSADRGGQYKASFTGVNYKDSQTFTMYTNKMAYPVTFEAIPDEGFHFVEWRKEASNGEVVTKDPILTIDGTTLNNLPFSYWAVFSSDPLISDIFTDVKESDWFAPAVLKAYQKGWMKGKSEGKFVPGASITRAEFAQILYAHSGKPGAGAENPFSDVKSGQWYTDAVLWAYQNGIVSGKKDKAGNPVFGVSQNITREEMAAMLYKYCIYKNYDMYTYKGASDGFADSDKIAPWAKAQMDWAVHRKIIAGKGGNRLDPQGKASRAECAQMIGNILY